MSEDNSQNSSEDTESSVPLKKETTRVTLKAAEGSAPPPPAPGAPPAPKPPAPAAPAAPSPPQATQPLKPAEPAAQPTAAKTVPLNPTPAASAPSQATVKLQPSSPSAPSLPGAGSAPLSTGQLSATLDDDGEEKGIKIVAIACLVLALVALLIEAFTVDKLAEVDSVRAEVGMLSIPYNDYDRKFVSDDEEDEFSMKFLTYSPDKSGKPRAALMGLIDESMPIKDYEEFKSEK
ncbi:MAG: hypothetical protein CMO39_04225 [Verrucomicrobiaceae bacterium]|nr:hypothetical protein [Verrucomicrobiaceae bacterium]